MKTSQHICAFLVLSNVLFLFSCSEPPPPPEVAKPVKAMQLGDRSGLSSRSFPGRAEAEQEAQLSFRVGGQVEELNVNVGDTVNKGDTLAILDQTDFKNALQIADAAVTQATAAMENAQANYDRALNVQKDDPGAISQTAIDRAKAAHDITKAAVDSATSARDIAADRLGYSELKAPFTGEVVATYIEAFESVILKQPVIRLLDRSNVEFKVDVPESLISYATQIASAVITFDAKPDVEILATVKEIGREASRGTRTFPVTLLLARANEFDILPGMAGSALISAQLAESEKTTIIPAAALMRDGDSSAVWVIVDNRLETQSVSVGLPQDFGIEVTSGLNPGDTIVVAGVNSLVEGQLVEAIK